MPRRFLTAEDVRRSGATEIVVDETTVITPQALAAARQSGISIRTASGEWREPQPDRGPDAPEGTHRPPHLPEPLEDAATGATAVVTAVGRNRPGVLSEITGEIAGVGGNIHDISQKMVEGYFHMVLVVELPPDLAFSDLKTRLERLGGAEDYAVFVMHERVFRFMHRI